MGQIDIGLGDIPSAHHKLPMFGDRTSPYYLISAATQLFLKSDYDSASDVYKKALAAFKKFHPGIIKQPMKDELIILGSAPGLKWQAYLLEKQCIALKSKS